MFVAPSAISRPNREHGRNRPVGIAADDLLQRRDDRGRRNDRIGQRMGQRAVSPGSPDRDAQLVARSHILPRAEAETAGRNLRRHMFAYESRDLVVTERILGQHERRSARAKLLAGLEKPEHRSLDSLAHPLQHEHRPKQAGRMDVVPAHASRPCSGKRIPNRSSPRSAARPCRHAARRNGGGLPGPRSGPERPFRLSARIRCPPSAGNRPHNGKSHALLERQLRDWHAESVGQATPARKHPPPPFDRIISFHTATIKIAFAGPTAGSATPKHQSTHPLSTGNRGARTFSSVGRPSADRFPTARRLVEYFRTVSRQFRQIGLYHPVPKSRAPPTRPVSGKQRYPANGLHTEPFSLRTTRAPKTSRISRAGTGRIG